MKNISFIFAIATSAMLLSGCSTAPRNFAASVSTPVADKTALERDYRTCQTLVRNGRKSDFKAGAASLLAGGAGAAGTGVLVTGLGAGVNIGTGAVSASFAAVPVVGVLAGFGVSRAIRGGKERKFKRAMSDCLGEYGYGVDGWTKLRKPEDAAAISATTVSLAPAPTGPAVALQDVPAAQ